MTFLLVIWLETQINFSHERELSSSPQLSSACCQGLLRAQFHVICYYLNYRHLIVRLHMKQQYLSDICLVRLLHGLLCITTKNDPVSKAI